MADLNNLTKLFQAIAARDWDVARTVALELTSAEERIGHHGAALRLRGALNTGGPQPRNGHSASHASELAASPSFLATALTRLNTDRALSSVRLKSSTRRELDDVLSEWSHREQLSARGLLRRSKLLFHGPPGCGKSVTARAVANELGFPAYVVRFDAVVGAYLGQTALHLRQLFRFAETTACVLLIDEIDALGKRRGSPLDVGELDRVVIALLQELEHSRPAGLLIATSNLARQLDDALWRRFDLVVEFPAPPKAELRGFATALAGERGISRTARLTAAMRNAKSYADVERLIEGEQRRLILSER